MNKVKRDKNISKENTKLKDSKIEKEIQIKIKQNL